MGDLMSYTFPLSDDSKVFLSNCIFRAITNDLPELIYENRLPTSVGSGQFRWNFINRNLLEDAPENFETAFAKRGGWIFILLRDAYTNLSFSIMSEKNFANLQKHPKQKEHYLEALVSQNEWREPISSQISIDGFFPDRDQSILSELRSQLFSGFTGIIDEHVLVLYDYNYSGVTTIRAVLLTPKLEIAASDDWTNFMRNTFIPTKTINVTSSGEEEDLVSLREEYTPNEQSIVEINTNNKRENKG